MYIVFQDVLGKRVNSLAQAYGKPDSFKAGPQSLGGLMVHGWHLTWAHLSSSKDLIDTYCQDGFSQSIYIFFYRLAVQGHIIQQCWMRLRIWMMDTEKDLFNSMMTGPPSYHCFSRGRWGWTALSCQLWKTHFCLPTIDVACLAFPNQTKKNHCSYLADWLLDPCEGIHPVLGLVNSFLGSWESQSPWDKVVILLILSQTPT